MTTFTTHTTSRAWTALAVCLLASLAAALGGAVPAGAVSLGPPKTLYVSASATSDPACAAASQTNPFATIAAALACVTDGSTIKLTAGTFAGGFTINRNVTLQGAGGATVISAPAGPVATTTAVAIADRRVVTLSKLTVDGGATQTDVVAGAGALTVVDSTIRNGLGRRGGGVAIAPGAGAGTATLTVLRSTLSGNQGMNSSGGGVSLAGAPDSGHPNVAKVIDSTLTDNGATSGEGGGVWVGASDSLAVRDSTFAGNRDNGFSGTSATVSLTNTIVAGTLGGARDCNTLGLTVVDGGHNLIGNGDGCAGFTNGVNGDQVGTSATPIDPHVGAPAANGGSTPTMALRLGSPAINAGDSADCLAAQVNDADQRGAKRNALARRACDIGAFDTGGVALQTLYVKSSAASDPACDAASQTKPFATVAAALACASDGTTIKLGPGTFTGGVSIAHNVTLQGAGATTVIVASTAPTGTTPLMKIADGHVVTLSKLTVDGGGRQTGVVAGAGALTVVDSTIRNSVGHGGGIDIAPGAGANHLTLLRSTLSDDVGLGYGGGILVADALDGTRANVVDVIDSTIADNLATYSRGGGVELGDFDSLIVRDSTIAGNDGGGLGSEDHSKVSLTNTIVARSANGQSDCDMAPSTVTTGGHDVIGNGDGCTGFSDGVDGNRVGTSAGPVDPQLGALAANGGPTPTMALLSSSPAIGAGDLGDCRANPVNGLDQRGANRNDVARSACDIGAYDTGGAAS